jgi:hypothetical protein
MFLKINERKDVRKDPQFSGQWKVPSLVAVKRNPMFKGQ